jgi:hypothetical protein
VNNLVLILLGSAPGNNSRSRISFFSGYKGLYLYLLGIFSISFWGSGKVRVGLITSMEVGAERFSKSVL